MIYQMINSLDKLLTVRLAMKPHNQSLRNFLKNLKTDDARDAFAFRCGTSKGYLKLVMYGNRKCSAALAISIDRESLGVVPCDDLCPDVDFQYVRNQVQIA